MIARAGFACADFSLNSYLSNASIYRDELNDFFSHTEMELEKFFRPHKEGAALEGADMHTLRRNYILQIIIQLFLPIRYIIRIRHMHLVNRNSG